MARFKSPEQLSAGRRVRRQAGRKSVGSKNDANELERRKGGLGLHTRSSPVHEKSCVSDMGNRSCYALNASDPLSSDVQKVIAPQLRELAGGQAFQVTGTDAFDFPGAASLRFLKGAGLDATSRHAFREAPASPRAVRTATPDNTTTVVNATVDQLTGLA